MPKQPFFVESTSFSLLCPKFTSEEMCVKLELFSVLLAVFCFVCRLAASEEDAPIFAAFFRDFDRLLVRFSRPFNHFALGGGDLFVPSTPYDAVPHSRFILHNQDVTFDSPKKLLIDLEVAEVGTCRLALRNNVHVIELFSAAHFNSCALATWDFDLSFFDNWLLVKSHWPMHRIDVYSVDCVKQSFYAAPSAHLPPATFRTFCSFSAEAEGHVAVLLLGPQHSAQVRMYVNTLCERPASEEDPDAFLQRCFVLTVPIASLCPAQSSSSATKSPPVLDAVCTTSRKRRLILIKSPDWTNDPHKKLKPADTWKQPQCSLPSAPSFALVRSIPSVSSPPSVANDAARNACVADRRSKPSASNFEIVSRVGQLIFRRPRCISRKASRSKPKCSLDQ